MFAFFLFFRHFLELYVTFDTSYYNKCLVVSSWPILPWSKFSVFSHFFNSIYNTWKRPLHIKDAKYIYVNIIGRMGIPFYSFLLLFNFSIISLHGLHAKSVFHFYTSTTNLTWLPLYLADLVFTMVILQFAKFSFQMTHFKFYLLNFPNYSYVNKADIVFNIPNVHLRHAWGKKQWNESRKLFKIVNSKIMLHIMNGSESFRSFQNMET